ncbi:MAG: AzlD domain-containing protein [Spirochaetia bacterium]
MSIPLIIIGMAVVTYIPRMVPFLALDIEKLPPKLRQFLSYIPITALGALLFPGVLTATPELPIAGITGVLSAFIVGYFRKDIIIPFTVCVLITYFVLFFIS